MCRGGLDWLASHTFNYRALFTESTCSFLRPLTHQQFYGRDDMRTTETVIFLTNNSKHRVPFAGGGLRPTDRDNHGEISLPSVAAYV